MANEEFIKDEKIEAKISQINSDNGAIMVPFSEEITQKKQKPAFLEVLGRLSPGKNLRTALDDILDIQRLQEPREFLEIGLLGAGPEVHEEYLAGHKNLLVSNFEF